MEGKNPQVRRRADSEELQMGITTRIMAKQQLEREKRRASLESGQTNLTALSQKSGQSAGTLDHRMRFLPGAAIPNSTIRSVLKDVTPLAEKTSINTLRASINLSAKVNHSLSKGSKEENAGISPLDKLRDSLRRRRTSSLSSKEYKPKSSSIDKDSRRISQRTSITMPILGVKRPTHESIKTAIDNVKEKQGLMNIDEHSLTTKRRQEPIENVKQTTPKKKSFTFTGANKKKISQTSSLLSIHAQSKVNLKKDSQTQTSLEYADA